ncbi:hypothetical protein SAMN05421770_102139 [Granulicella rosea]|uniref:EamA domain-containing protein n=1 Tax=Granulicella rosea TaxID=474952 RepID=A0A239GZ67_9BACT|nr:EamA family transporter [Granulicella rosea]SNS74088.1 hypothetical protein SAMN05421770_102139 [Granulicella rosea]
MTHHTSTAVTWTAIACVALFAIAGEVLIAAAMRNLGDLDLIRAKSGLPGTIRAVLGSPLFLVGAFCMAFNYFAQLFLVSRVDLSLALPAVGSCTYVGNAIAAKYFLHENVDRRRWMAALFVCVGVYLLTK